MNQMMMRKRLLRLLNDFMDEEEKIAKEVGRSWHPESDDRYVGVSRLVSHLGDEFFLRDREVSE